jgi:hypothetical protein
MAAIDKLYGTFDQWCELHTWVANSTRPQYCRYFYPTPEYGKTGPITNTPIRVDIWLYKNCPFDWVKKQLIAQYNPEFWNAI